MIINPFILAPAFPGTLLRIQFHNGDLVPLGLYQDAACTTPATDQDDPVGGVKDKYGEGPIVATQSDNAKRPTLHFLNGAPVLKFVAASQQHLVMSDFINLGSAEVTVVAPIFAADVSFRPWLEQQSSGAANRFVLWSANSQARVYPNTLDTGINLLSNTWWMDTYRRVGTTITHRANLSNAESFTAATFSATGGSFAIGRGDNALDAYFNGYIGGIFITSDLTDQAAEIIRNYAAPLVQPESTITSSGYVMTTFKEGDLGANATLRMLLSSDGITFTEAVAMFTPTLGQVRDPSLLRRNEGWWVAHTSGSFDVGQDSFGLAYSTDGALFRTVANVDVSAISGVQHTWAPEWFVDDDDSVHIIFAATTEADPNDGGFVQYEIHPTNADWTTWSSPAALTGLPSNCIDAFIVRDGSTYEAWIKNEDTDYIEVYTASSLTGSYSSLHTGNWASWGSGIEGPCLVDMGGGNWRLYVDLYAISGGIAYASSSDDRATWSSLTTVTAPSPITRHGGVIKID